VRDRTGVRWMRRHPRCPRVRQLDRMRTW